MEEYDVFISGAGHAGLISAIAFANSGFSVCCVDPKNSQTDVSNEGSDHRTTAHLIPSMQFLSKIGVWEQISENACPLETLKILNINRDGFYSRQPSETNFSSSELNVQAFGYNIPLASSLLSLEKIAQDNSNIDLVFGTSYISSEHRGDKAIVKLTNGLDIAVKLVVGADGKHSSIRNEARIGVIAKDTNQEALVFNVVHEKPHSNTSFEIYDTGGPLTTIPIKTANHKNHSSVIWMDNASKINLLANNSTQQFEKKLKGRTFDVLGHMRVISSKGRVPILIQLAKKLIGKRTVLIGEAAHVLPPIGAQGFNITIQDINLLSKLAERYPRNLGCPQMLQEFQNKRFHDIMPRMTAVGALNGLAYSKSPVLQFIRSTGLKAINKIPPVKYALMRFGLGNN